MRRTIVILSASLSVLVLAACSASLENREQTSAMPQGCAVRASRDFEAWINRMPGPGATPTLHVAGKVEMPSGGYSFEWEPGPLDRSAMPALRLKLVPKAPTGMATQAITSEELSYSMPATVPRYSRVIIGCGARTLAEITSIQDAH